MKPRGNCYVTSEALYHLLGGKAAGWVPMNMRWEGESHWFLRNRITSTIVDVTVSQFKHRPNYGLARGRGFLTRRPSAAATRLMGRLVYGSTWRTA